MILRDRDANGNGGWTGASDGTLEERRFFGQNWRAGVSLVMNGDGRPLQRIKFSAYGVAATLTDLDYNGDGAIDPDDSSDFITTPYDWDLDGSVNPAPGYNADSNAFAADVSTHGGNTFGRGTLSLGASGNRLGYAGYVGDRFIAGGAGGALVSDGKYHVRHRVYDPGMGRWTRRDPLGYVGEQRLVAYCADQPSLFTEPRGPNTTLRPTLARHNAVC